MKIDRLFIMQSLKYLVVGGLSFLADYGTYWIISSFLHYQIATYTGLIIGLIVNYILSKLWVFSNNAPVDKKEIFTFIAFTALGFALTGLGMYIGVELIRANDKFVKFIVAVIVFVLNFLARKYIIFKETPKA